jgi:spermidine synthase
LEEHSHSSAGPPGSNPGPPWLLPALTGLFFLSGASALIYQVLWLRLLGLVFGVTVYAASTVWAGFMAGLAIGSLAAGRLADRVSHPLRWFAATELGIGLSAASTPWVFDLLRGYYAGPSPGLDDSFAQTTALHFAVSFAILLVPTTLMGATLPLVLRSSLSRSTTIGAATGLLYGGNTTGAIAGTLAAGLLLIPRVGMATTFRLAAALNIVAALCALALSPSIARAESRSAPSRDDRSVEPRVSALARTIVLTTFTVSGAVALALEVIWLRAAVIIVGSTVYAASILLATILFGIAAGSYLAAPWLNRGRSWLLPLATLEGAIAISGVLSIALLTRTTAVAAALPASLAAALPPYLVPVVTASVLVALPTSLLMGVAFPVGLHLWASGDDGGNQPRLASRVGLFYALNVCGGIAGSLLAGFVLLPLLGSRLSVIAVSGVTLLTSLMLLGVSQGRNRRVRGAIAVVVVAVFGAAAWSAPEPAQSLLAQRHPTEPMIWLEEGIQTTASIHTFLGGRRRVMYLDGYHQAGDDGGSRSTHYKIGTLPLAIHPNPHTALVVGLGGGSTAGAMSRYSRLAVDVVELSETVVRAADFFSHINFDVLKRPNVHLRVDDGRNYLATTRQRYDVITADTIQPVRAGAANLYSAEYFTLVRDALNDDGLALQWFAGTDAEYRLVARTFSQVFPFVTLWDDGTLMVGTKQPLALSPSDFNWKLQVPELREALASIEVRSFDDLLTLYRAGSDDLRAFLGPGPVLTDDRPILEYFLSLPRDRLLDLRAVRRDPQDIAAGSK